MGGCGQGPSTGIRRGLLAAPGGQSFQSHGQPSLESGPQVRAARDVPLQGRGLEAETESFEDVHTHQEPTAWDLQQLYRNRPTTTIATCTRRAAALVNNLSIWALFTTRKKRELASLPVDWEANAENYDQDGRGGWVAVRRLCQVVIFIPKGTKDSINNAPRKYSPVRVKLPFAHQQNVCRPPRFRERRQVPAMFAKVIVSCRQIQWDKCRICSFPLDATWSLGIAPRVLKPRHATGEPQQAHHWPAASGVGHEALQRHAAAHHPQRQQRGGLHQRHGVRRRELRAQIQVCARQDKDEQALGDLPDHGLCEGVRLRDSISHPARLR